MKPTITTLLLVMHLLGMDHLIPTGEMEKSVLPKGSIESRPIARIAYATQPRPIATAGNTSFALAAGSAYAIDRDSGVVLYSQDANQERPIASITKLSSALVLLRVHSPQDRVTVSALPVYGPSDAVLGLAQGEGWSFGNLFAAMLIKSANDAADALAIYDSGSLQAFTTKMNVLAGEWSIDHTNFASPSGLVDSNNYSTAASLAKIAGLALSNDTLRQLVSTQNKVIKDNAGKAYYLESTNLLLKDNRFHGIKTGYTLAAGQSVVALARIKGHDVITVVLASPDRFGETTTLVNYLEGAYTWQ